VPQPAEPKIYHIVHIDKLPWIVAAGRLWSDAIMAERNSAGTVIGMSTIKDRRRRLRVDCHPGLCVGDFVPFYFCPRSIMLYLIHMANHPDLAYRGGQGPIIHLEADLNRVVQWAEVNDCRWAFSLSNAGAFYAEFRSSLDKLGEINWTAVEARDFRAPDIRHGKQAEFLMHRSFPWELVERIGALSQGIAQQVANTIKNAAHRPPIEITGHWYY
jgi:ssDNA thymidine ADP-ribosyltransferase, DarT